MKPEQVEWTLEHIPNEAAASGLTVPPPASPQRAPRRAPR
jgi:hypothetical protein